MASLQLAFSDPQSRSNCFARSMWTYGEEVLEILISGGPSEHTVPEKTWGLFKDMEHLAADVASGKNTRALPETPTEKQIREGH